MLFYNKNSTCKDDIEYIYKIEYWLSDIIKLTKIEMKRKKS